MSVGYNVGARYEIIGRIPKGTHIAGYVLKDKTLNTMHTMDKGIVEQLALNKQIYNCTGQIYNNIVNIKGINCKLSKMPRFDWYGNRVCDVKIDTRQEEADLKLVGKVTTGRTVSDYIVAPISEPSKQMKIPKDMVVQLVQDGRIINAKCQFNGGEVMLRGINGTNLAQLQAYQDA